MVYQVEKRVDGLDWEIRVGPSGEIHRIEQDLRVASLPAPVLQAANGYRPGYPINPDDTPKLMDRGGEATTKSSSARSADGTRSTSASPPAATSWGAAKR